MQEMNPWRTIWSKPRETYRKVFRNNPLKTVLALAIIFGIINGISWIAYFWARYPLHEGYKKPLFVIFMIVGGAIYGLINLYFGAWIYKWTGRWIGGKGNFTEVKCAVGWSFYPFIIATLFALLSYVFDSYPILGLIFGLLNLVFIVWGIVIFLNLLGEAHQFSAWKALGAVVIAFILIFVVFILIALLIPMIQPLFKA